MEAKYSSETLVYARSTRRHIPEDGIFHNIQHHKKSKMQDSISSFTFVFFMKVKTVESRKSTVGRFTCQQKQYYLQPKGAGLYQCTVSSRGGGTR
jgi:hypothetical protein